MQREAGHFAAELGDDPLGDGRTDSRQGDEFFHILLFDGGRHLPHGTHDGPQGLPHADAVDRADQLEELDFRLVHEADHAGRQASLLRVPFDVFDRPQADRLADFGLQLPPHEFGHKDLVFERPHFQHGLVVAEPQEFSGNLGDHATIRKESI